MCRKCCPRLQTSPSPGRSSAQSGQNEKKGKSYIKILPHNSAQALEVLLLPQEWLCVCVCVWKHVCVWIWAWLRSNTETHTVYFFTHTHTVNVNLVQKDDDGSTGYHSNSHANAAYTLGRTGRWGWLWWKISLRSVSEQNTPEAVLTVWNWHKQKETSRETAAQTHTTD